MINFEIQSDIDLNIRYNHSAETETKNWLLHVLPSFAEFKNVFDSRFEMHGLKLTKDHIKKTVSGFDQLAKYLREKIADKYEKEPWHVRDSVFTSMNAFIAELSTAWSKLLQVSRFNPSISPGLITRFKSYFGLVDFIQIDKDGVGAFIGTIKDEFYIKYESVEDYRFIQEVEELAEHYNRVTSRLRGQDRLIADRLMFIKDSDGVVHTRKEELRRYQSMFGEAIKVSN